VTGADPGRPGRRSSGSRHFTGYRRRSCGWYRMIVGSCHTSSSRCTPSAELSAALQAGHTPQKHPLPHRQPRSPCPGLGRTAAPFTRVEIWSAATGGIRGLGGDGFVADPALEQGRGWPAGRSAPAVPPAATRGQQVVDGLGGHAPNRFPHARRIASTVDVRVPGQEQGSHGPAGGFRQTRRPQAERRAADTLPSG